MATDRTIRISVRQVYGNETFYPACPTSRQFANIAGTVTLKPATLRTIMDMGYRVEIETPKVTLMEPV